MSNAKVYDVDAIRSFRVALVKFIEVINVALSDADSDVLRTLHWIELQQVPYWQQQIRKRQELVTRCKDAVRQKELYKDATGRTQNAFDERKALKKAEASLVVAQEKFERSKSWVRRLQRQHQEFRGQTSKLQMFVTGELGHTVVKLGNLATLIQQYTATQQQVQATSSAAVESGADAEPVAQEPPARQKSEGGTDGSL